ncbi:MAG TPA: hypothetical protein VME47_12575 [Acetobacteraceae bacterium]|nr:hypothetical protein [Acetobacteraceae bacterium]
MKKGEQPEFSAKWWKDEQPKGLKSAGELGNALKDYETAKHKLGSTGKASDADDVWDALDDVKRAVKAVIAEASKAKDNAEMDATVDCLDKFDRGYTQEERWIEEHTKGGTFTDPEAYQEYLATVLKRLRTSRGMNFGFVLGKKAEDHRLALHRSKAARALAMMLVKETGIQQMTFGTARADKDDSEALLLILEGRQLPGMAKKGERMLMKMMPLPFKKMNLEVEGKKAKDLDDPEDRGR